MKIKIAKFIVKVLCPRCVLIDKSRVRQLEAKLVVSHEDMVRYKAEIADKTVANGVGNVLVALIRQKGFIVVKEKKDDDSGMTTFCASVRMITPN